jgi:hypothetical protein
MEPRYPNITVKLIGEDGNAFGIIGKATRALLRGGVPQAEIKEFQAEAISGDYNHLLKTVGNWMEVE